jgi:hypothetical protein
MPGWEMARVAEEKTVDDVADTLAFHQQFQQTQFRTRPSDRIYDVSCLD